MRLTGLQIAAAITLSGLTREALATEAGIGRNTLDRIINNTATYREDTIRKIISILETRGVEFLPSEGVRLKPVTVDILTGREGLREFFDGVHEYAGKHGGTIMMFGIDETTFIETITPEFSQDYLKRMTEVSRRRGDLEVLAIICEGDTNFCASAYNEYRWISKDIFQAVPFYIYGETLAIMDFDTTPGPTIMLLKSRAITNAYRKQFQAFWKMAYPPPVTNDTGKA
jgi:transcriptional regulator with XRE-family HTH domain